MSMTANPRPSPKCKLGLIAILILILASGIAYCQSPPAAPTIVTPVSGGTVPFQKPVIRWIGDAHDQYEIHINTTGVATDANSWDSGQSAGTDDSYDSGVLTNGSYHVFVRLHNSAGWGLWSAGRSFSVNFTNAEQKKGWILLRDDLPYSLDLLTHAREYHVNHLQISHDIMMYAWQPINNLTIRNKINQLTNTAHANGIPEVVVWVHDIQYTNLPAQYMVGGKVNLDDQGFWDWMDNQYEQLFTVCPNLDGLVFTFSENFEGGADFNDRLETIHTGKTPEDSMAQAIQTLWNVCSRHNKSLYVRTWLDAGVDRWCRNAIMRNDSRIWMMSKATGAGDWNVIQEDYDIIGTCAGHPELMEFDVNGEYWNYTYTPWCGVEYLRHLYSDFGLSRGVRGVAARIDHNDQSSYVGIHPKSIEGPDRISMFALDALVDSPTLTTDTVFDYWSNHWFGPVAGSHVAASLKRNFDITNSVAATRLSSPSPLPLIYPTSTYVARDDAMRSTFDLNAVKSILSAQTNFTPGSNNYDVFYWPLNNAVGLLNLQLPCTLFGDFAPTYSTQTNPTCSATVVDSYVGLNPGSFRVEYSTDAGVNWTNHTNFTVASDGGVMDAYHITANSVPFTTLRAARNKIRFTATNTSNTVETKVYTVRGLSEGFATLGTSVASDGILHPQGGDGDTTGTTAGGRACRTPLTSSDTSMYFQADDGFAYDKSPSTLYLQVDYYGTSGSITPYYDSVWRTDDPLPPVYLSGGSGWRTATWRLNDVNFGHRIGFQAADIKLYVGSANSVIYVSSVKLSYSAPTGYMAQPQGLAISPASSSSTTMAWQPVTGATRYQVCRNGTAVGWPTSAGYTDTGLSANTTYAYAVTAFDASDNTSCGTWNTYATTFCPAASPTILTSNPQPRTWVTNKLLAFTTTGGFGAGKTAYYQYVLDESPTHAWTGNETYWPTLGPPSGTGWNVWRPTSSPTDSPQWLLYEGSTTQRCMSEVTTTEDGVPTWLLLDQGRVVNTKAKIANWPNFTISRDVGVTVAARMKCLDVPSGWYNTTQNLSINMPDCGEGGAAIRPDSVQLLGPNASGTNTAVSNGYGYYTFTLTMKNATPGNNNSAAYKLYRDGILLTSLTQGPSGASPWSGVCFGHSRSDATGGWAWEWIAWNNTGAFVPTTSGSLGQMAAHNGSSFYFHAKAYNANGVANGTIDLGPYYIWNGSAPVSPTVTDDGQYTTPSHIHATWTPCGPSPSYYEYAIGTTSGGQQVVPFTNCGLVTEITRDDLNLQAGQTYYVTVRGTIGSNSATGTSDGITVAPVCDRISEAKTHADGTAVTLQGKAVTATFPTCAYIQDYNGAGIRIVSSTPITAGTNVSIAGTLAGAVQERQINADVVISSVGGTFEPVAMATRSVGGQDYYYNGQTTGQLGPVGFVNGTQIDVPGPNNIGSLVRVMGKVTARAADSFYIDDGSGIDDFAVIGPGSPRGIKVLLTGGGTPPALNSYAVVTGISSLYEAADGFHRVILVRQQGYVITVN